MRGLGYALAAPGPASRKTGPSPGLSGHVQTGLYQRLAAGVIHTDFGCGFIRAQTNSYEDYVAPDGEQGSSDARKMRAEGWEYVVQELPSSLK